MNQVSMGTVPPPPRNTQVLSSETAWERPGGRKTEREKRMSLDSEITFGGIQYGLSNPWPFWVWFLRGRILQAPLLGGSDGKESACSRRRRFNPWVGKIPWRREWLPIPVFLPGEFHGQKSLVGYNPRGCKKSGVTERLTLSPLLSSPRSDSSPKPGPAAAQHSLG